MIVIPKINTNRYKINQLEIELPSGTRPIMIIIPEMSNKVASKFRIRKALYEADATKKANNANIVADRGVKINSKIQPKWFKIVAKMFQNRGLEGCCAGQNAPKSRSGGVLRGSLRPLGTSWVRRCVLEVVLGPS